MTVLVTTPPWCRRLLWRMLKEIVVRGSCLTGSPLLLQKPPVTSSHSYLALQVLWGRPTISQELGGLRFDVSARSFFQTNSAQAAQLVHMLAQAAGATLPLHPSVM